MREILHVVRLNGVLIHGIARSSADAQILRSLEKSRCNREPVEFGPQAADNIRRGDFPLIQRLQRDIDTAGVPGARMGNDIGDRRVSLDDLLDLQDRVVHDRKRCILRASRAACDGSRILLREKTLRDNFDEIKIQRNRED